MKYILKLKTYTKNGQDFQYHLLNIEEKGYSNGTGIDWYQGGINNACSIINKFVPKDNILSIETRIKVLVDNENEINVTTHNHLEMREKRSKAIANNTMDTFEFKSWSLYKIKSKYISIPHVVSSDIMTKVKALHEEKLIYKIQQRGYNEARVHLNNGMCLTLRTNEKTYYEDDKNLVMIPYTASLTPDGFITSNDFARYLDRYSYIISFADFIKNDDENDGIIYSLEAKCFNTLQNGWDEFYDLDGAQFYAIYEKGTNRRILVKISDFNKKFKLA